MSLAGIPLPFQLEADVLEPSDPEPETGTVALADELSTALAAPEEPRHQQDADAFEASDPSEDELCELYAVTLQEQADPAAEVSRIGALIADAIPGAMITFTSMRNFTFGSDGRLVRDSVAWACLVTSGVDGWHTYQSGASMKMAAARALEAWAKRPCPPVVNLVPAV